MFISHKVPKQSQSRLDFVNFLHFKFVKRERERDWWAEVKQTNTNNSDVDIEIVEQQTYGHTPTLYRQVTFHNWPDISLALIFAIAQSPSIYWIFMYEAIWRSPLSQNKRRFIWDWGSIILFSGNSDCEIEKMRSHYLAWPSSEIQFSYQQKNDVYICLSWLPICWATLYFLNLIGY